MNDVYLMRYKYKIQLHFGRIVHAKYDVRQPHMDPFTAITQVHDDYKLPGHCGLAGQYRT